MDYVVVNVLVTVVCTGFAVGFGISIGGMVRLYIEDKQIRGEWKQW